MKYILYWSNIQNKCRENMQKYAGLYVKYAEVYFTFMIYMHSPLPLCWWVWGPSIGVALVSPCLIVTAAIARVWIMGFVSGRLSQPCLALGRWNPSQPGPCDSSESSPNLSRMKDCTVNSLSEGLHCQNCQNTLSEVQNNLSDPCCPAVVRVGTGSYGESGTYESWKTSWCETAKQWAKICIYI